MKALTVSELARAADVGTETVRHYEEIGLLPKAVRSDNGYRHFPVESLQRMGFIKRAKALGFGLTEIAELLKLSDQSKGDTNTDMVLLREAASTKLADIEGRIGELQRIREGLMELIANCPGKGRLAACPILSALADTANAVNLKSPAQSACSQA